MPARAIKKADVPITPAAITPLFAPLFPSVLPVAAGAVLEEAAGLDVGLWSCALLFDEVGVVAGSVELELELDDVEVTVVGENFTLVNTI
jgi:hypothetical protein